MTELYKGKITIYAQICCDQCNEVIHNHLDCPVCGEVEIDSENYGAMERGDELVCECGATFTTPDHPYDVDAVWTQKEVPEESDEV